MSERSFRFKPIETRYNGYRFRSRLEARWAVFFDELGIEYQYEPEGYALGGIPYLPDFWIPEQKCFFEVKGEKPTENEIEKAKRLALYTHKLVYIASGSISLPPNDISTEITFFAPPTLTKTKRLFDQHGNLVDTLYDRPEISPEVLLLRQKLFEAKIYPKLDIDGLMLEQLLAGWVGQVAAFDIFLEDVRNQLRLLEQIAPLFRSHGEELAKALAVTTGWENNFSEELVIDGVYWAECNLCGDLSLTVMDHPHDECPKGQGLYQSDTPRLIAAYTAAREARF